MTATSTPNQTMSYLSATTTGWKIGRNTRMMAGHSNGQPSRKISAMMMMSITTGATGSDTSSCVTHCAEPKRENTAPKMFEATARNSTMLDVVMVLTQAALRPA